MKKFKKVLNKVLVLGVALNLIFATLVYVFPAKGVAQVTGAHFQGGNFFVAANVSQNGGWGDPINADKGNVINYKAQITNDGTEDAQNVQIKVDLPQGQSQSLVSTFKVKADNVIEVSDTATVNVSSSQKMDFLPGHTYLIQPDGTSQKISDSIWQDWVNVGVVHPGTTVFIQIAFKTQLTNIIDFSLALNKQVSNSTCHTNWAEGVVAAPGEVVAYKLEIRNTSPEGVHDILVRDVLPAGLSYKTDEPIKVVYPDGHIENVTDYGALSGNGINVGVLDPYIAPTYRFIEVIFRAIVDQNATGTLTNTGRVRSLETNWIEDTSTVTVGAGCVSVTPTVTPTPTLTPTPGPSATPTPTTTVTPTPTVTLTPTPTPTNVPGNNPPVCDDLSVNPASGGKGLNVTLRGKGHHDSVNGDYINWIRFDYGDGTETTVDQNFGNNVDYSLTHKYENTGEFTARFYLRDSVGASRGGDGACEKKINIYSTQPSLTVVEQPRTGGEVVISIVMAMAGMLGLVVKRFI